MNFAEAIRRVVGDDADLAQIYVLAQKLLGDHKNIFIALPSFVEALRRNDKWLTCVARLLLQVVADDMRGKAGASQKTGESRWMRDRPGDSRPDAAVGARRNAHESRAVFDRPAAAAESRATKASQVLRESQTTPDRPRRPAPVRRKRSAASYGIVLTGIFARKLGGEVTIGKATLEDWENFEKKGLVVAHVGKRMRTEIKWPDRTTPTFRVATEEQVKNIVQSGYAHLDELGMTNVKPL